MTQIDELYSIFLKVKKVSTDTRQIQGPCIFFALKGDRFNGNLYAQQALDKGAILAVVDEESAGEGDRLVRVPNALKTLQLLAQHHRRQLGIPVIAITGSNGKTTTKELVTKVLASSFRVAATAGNFNNHIGVPLTLLAMPDDTQLAVVEMGDNRIGDITELCLIAEPTHGLVTNIGKDHLEGFGGFEGNIRAKSELYHYLIQQQGACFVPATDPILSNMARNRMTQPYLYGAPDTQAFLSFQNLNPFIVYLDEEGKQRQTQLLGAYNMDNIQSAYAIGKHFGVSVDAMHEAICAYQPQNNRSQLVQMGGYTIILDAYNANPSSVEAALNSFAQIDTDRPKVVVLGDMLELGESSQEEHRNMAQLALSLPFWKSAFCGVLYVAVAQSEGLFFNEKSQASAWLSEHLPPNAMILLKGSRGMKMEALLEMPPFRLTG